MKPVVLALEKRFGREMKFIVVDVNTDQGYSLAGQYRVDLIPSFFILDKKGEVTNKEVGVLTEEKLANSISGVLN